MNKPKYIIQDYNKLFNIWMPFNFIEYSSLQTAKKVIDSYKVHGLGVKFRVLKQEVIEIK